MARRKSDFVRDREFNAVPDIHAPLETKIRYQRHLMQRWQNAEKPSDILDIPLEDDRWWTHPTNPSPEYIQQQIKRQMKRYVNER